MKVSEMFKMCQPNNVDFTTLSVHANEESMEWMDIEERCNAVRMPVQNIKKKRKKRHVNDESMEWMDNEERCDAVKTKRHKERDENDESMDWMYCNGETSDDVRKPVEKRPKETLFFTEEQVTRMEKRSERTIVRLNSRLHYMEKDIRYIKRKIRAQLERNDNLLKQFRRLMNTMDECSEGWNNLYKSVSRM